MNAGALEALHGLALRVELGALGRRDGRVEIGEASVERAERVDREDGRRQEARAPSIGEPCQEPPEQRWQRGVEREQVVRVVVVEATPVLRQRWRCPR